MKYLLVVSYIMACSGLYGHGFTAQTLVKTPQGYTAIEKLELVSRNPLYWQAWIESIEDELKVKRLLYR